MFECGFFSVSQKMTWCVLDVWQTCWMHSFLVKYLLFFIKSSSFVGTSPRGVQVSAGRTRNVRRVLVQMNETNETGTRSQRNRAAFISLGFTLKPKLWWTFFTIQRPNDRKTKGINCDSAESFPCWSVSSRVTPGVVPQLSARSEKPAGRRR